MNPKLVYVLDNLLSDVQADSSKLSTLFWLRAFTTLAAERQTARLRWAKLSGFVSRTARAFGINRLDHAPGRALLTDYSLVQAVPSDGSGEPIWDPETLRTLELGRDYDVELRSAYQADLGEITAWVNEAWEGLRSGEDASA